MGTTLVTFLTFCFLDSADKKLCDLTESVRGGVARFETVMVPRGAMTAEGLRQTYCSALAHRKDKHLFVRLAGRGKRDGDSWWMEWGDFRGPKTVVTPEILFRDLGSCRKKSGIVEAELYVDMTMRGGDGHGRLSGTFLPGGFSSYTSVNRRSDFAAFVPGLVRAHYAETTKPGDFWNRDADSLPAYEWASADYPDCRKFWSEILTLDVAAVLNGDLPPLPRPGACRPPEELSSEHGAYVKRCADFRGSPMLPLPSDEGCRYETVAYRAALRQWTTRGVPIASITDVGVLAEKLYWVRVGAHGYRPVAQQREVLNRLLELEPHNAAMLSLRDAMDAVERMTSSMEPAPITIFSHPHLTLQEFYAHRAASP